MPDSHYSTSGNPDWRAIADRLANRLANHAYCDYHGRFADPCPFCADRAAYAAYAEAAGIAAVEPSGESVALHEVEPHWPTDDGGAS